MSRVATFYEIVSETADGACLCGIVPDDGEPMDVTVTSDGASVVHHMRICPACQPFIPEMFELLESEVQQ